ncbi:unnamed protein product, partial [Prunus brigantina]
RFFKPSRGLRQGDPLSPYLFILVNDVLSHLISSECARGSLHGIRLCNGSPTLSLLLFADDTLLFTKASVVNCSRMTHILDAYCAASGQLINLDKSNMYFSPNTPDHIKRSVCSVLKIKEADNPGKYLGLPSVWGSSKKEALGYIKERILKLIHGWSNKELSHAGKEVLIKAVATAIPAYPMTCFKLPITLCNEINMVMSSLWWGDNASGRKIHWKKWAGLGEAKSCGGLGFCDLAEKGGRASWAWNSLLAGRDVILSGARWQIMGGNSVMLWEDSWLPSSNHGYLRLIALVPSTGPRMVADIIDWDHKT